MAERAEPGLADRIESCKGTEILRASANLTRAYEILCLNYTDLERLLTWYSVPENVIGSQRLAEQERRRRFWLDIDRNLHNYVASVKTLIDHMRRFRSKEPHARFQAGYDRRLKELTNSDLSTLVPDLRSYFLHFDIPPIGSLLISGPGENEFETHVVLDCEKLLEWRKWRPQSRDYIERSGSSLQVLDVVQEYQREIAGFFKWFRMELLDTYKAEIDERQKLIKAEDQQETTGTRS